jgi:DNA recombination protein RmuC
MDTALIIGLALGLPIGISIGWWLATAVRHVGQQQAGAAASDAVQQLIQQNGQLLAAEALHRDRLAASEAQARHGLIDQQLHDVRAELRLQLNAVGQSVHRMASDSSSAMAAVTAQIDQHAAFTRDLAATTGQLREALSSSKARGQWGERMAEDVLRLAGFVEHVNYEKQTALDDRSGIPDFTFVLPRGQRLYMDVKFPLSAYLRFLEADSDSERTRLRREFLADVRMRVKELARRDYATKGDSALTNVLLFIPNETISGFIHEHEPSLFDDAMRASIVLCSPLTLFAMLGVIRQAADNLMIEERTDEVLGHLGTFATQWTKYCDQLDKVAAGFASVHKQFEVLNTTRRAQLSRPLAKIDAIRTERGVQSLTDMRAPSTSTHDELHVALLDFDESPLLAPP